MTERLLRKIRSFSHQIRRKYSRANHTEIETLFALRKTKVKNLANGHEVSQNGCPYKWQWTIINVLV